MSDGSPTPPPNSSPAGSVTSQEAAKKSPSQGKFKSGIQNKRLPNKVDINRHGIRREPPVGQTKKTRPKKV